MLPITIILNTIRHSSSLEGKQSYSKDVSVSVPSPSEQSDKATPSKQPSSDKATPSKQPSSDKATPSKQPSSDKATPSKQPSSDKDIHSKQPSSDKDTPSKQQSSDKATPSKQQSSDKATPSKQPSSDRDTPSKNLSSDIKVFLKHSLSQANKVPESPYEGVVAIPCTPLSVQGYSIPTTGRSTSDSQVTPRHPAPGVGEHSNITPVDGNSNMLYTVPTDKDGLQAPIIHTTSGHPSSAHTSVPSSSPLVDTPTADQCEHGLDGKIVSWPSDTSSSTTTLSLGEIASPSLSPFESSIIDKDNSVEGILIMNTVEEEEDIDTIKFNELTRSTRSKRRNKSLNYYFHSTKSVSVPCANGKKDKITEHSFSSTAQVMDCTQSEAGFLSPTHPSKRLKAVIEDSFTMDTKPPDSNFSMCDSTPLPPVPSLSPSIIPSSLPAAASTPKALQSKCVTDSQSPNIPIQTSSESSSGSSSKDQGTAGQLCHYIIEGTPEKTPSQEGSNRFSACALPGLDFNASLLSEAQPSHSPTETQPSHSLSKAQLGHSPSEAQLGHSPTEAQLGHSPSEAQLGHSPTEAQLGHSPTEAQLGHSPTEAQLGHSPSEAQLGHSPSGAQPSHSPTEAQPSHSSSVNSKSIISPFSDCK